MNDEGTRGARLAGEAVVTKGYGVTSVSAVSALSFEPAGRRDRARITMGRPLRVSLAGHGLASEATLHDIP